MKTRASNDRRQEVGRGKRSVRYAHNHALLGLKAHSIVTQRESLQGPQA